MSDVINIGFQLFPLQSTNKQSVLCRLLRRSGLTYEFHWYRLKNMCVGANTNCDYCLRDQQTCGTWYDMILECQSLHAAKERGVLYTTTIQHIFSSTTWRALMSWLRWSKLHMNSCYNYMQNMYIIIYIHVQVMTFIKLIWPKSCNTVSNPLCTFYWWNWILYWFLILWIYLECLM